MEPIDAAITSEPLGKKGGANRWAVNLKSKMDKLWPIHKTTIYNFFLGLQLRQQPG